MIFVNVDLIGGCNLPCDDDKADIVGRYLLADRYGASPLQTT